MIWDDQSIMDGYGSYPDWLQASHVFQVRRPEDTSCRVITKY